MTCVLKDFSFAITYPDDIIIFRMAEEHLSYIKQVFEKLRNAHLLMKLSKMSFLHKGNLVPQTYSKHQRHQTSTIKNPSHKQHVSTKTSQTSMHIPWTCQIYGKFIKNFAKMAMPLTLWTCQKAKFEWAPIHHTAVMMLKESVTQAPILHYLDQPK